MKNDDVGHGFVSVPFNNTHCVALQTTRHFASEQSQAPFDGFNLALHVGDNPTHVQHNRLLLLQALQPLGLDALCWVNQVHGVDVHVATPQIMWQPPTADAIVTTHKGLGCCILTADCLPVVFADTQGQVVGCAHAGWRGLLAGILENTVIAMRDQVNHSIEIHAWLGAAIGPTQFEVGAEVVTAFTNINEHYAAGFQQQSTHKYLADIYLLARICLASVGVAVVMGGNNCTVVDQHRFYSYRGAENNITGRMATIVMLVA